MNQHAKRRYQAGLRDQPLIKDEASKAILRRPAVGAGLSAFVVEDSHAGERLDRALAEVSGLSRARLKSLIDLGLVGLDGHAIADGAVKLRAGQTLTLDAPEPANPEPKGEAIPLNVVFEDDDLIVINKPAGLVVHPAAGHATGTLVNALIAHCGASLSGVGGVRRPGIVHRLDKDTSGLMVAAKTDAAHRGLSALFADHGRTLPFERAYLALVWGTPERGAGVIATDIGRHPHQRERQTVLAEGRGREAVTHFSVERRFPTASLIRCLLETGRTHQIRVHLAHIGTPVIGDPIYGAGFRTKAALLAPRARALADGLGRQALHAATLAFDHPVSGAPLRFESFLPADMAALAEALADESGG